MDRNQAEGAARGVAGRAQEAIGDITGDVGRKAEGVARQVAGQAQEIYGDAKDAAGDAVQAVGRQVEQQPVISLLVAGGVGFLLGVLTARR